MVHDRLPFRRRKRILEVGCGVGAQTEILLRHFPELHVTGIDIQEDQLAEARRFLATVPVGDGPRYESDAWTPRSSSSSQRASTARSSAGSSSTSPARSGSCPRCAGAAPGAPVVCSEVLNATFFLDPYSPDTLRYWMAYNDRQLELGGDPFIGAKLGNLLSSVGFRDVVTDVKTFHLDNRAPGERTEMLAYWTELCCRVRRRCSRRARSRRKSSTA